MAEALRVNLLGSPTISQGEQPVTGFVSSKAQALVFYLAEAGGTHTRDALAGLLWSDVPDATARKNLRDVLSNLRKLIGPYLTITRQTVALDPQAPVQIDSVRLSASLAAAQLAEPPVPMDTLKALADAIRLYRGEFLTGFFPADAPLFDEWSSLKRGELERALREALGLLAYNYGLRGEHDTAISYAQRWADRDPLQESAHRTLIELYARSGDRAAALRQYETCVAVLREELAIEPSPQTVETAERIRAGEFPTELLPLQISEIPPAPGLPPFKGLEYFDVADADLFFGREALVAELIGRLRSGRFLAVVGASGSGKSSLVRAGLVPALRQGEALTDGTLPPPDCGSWPIHILTPTAHPLEALAASLARESESVTATATLMDDLARDRRALHLYVQRLLPPTPTLPPPGGGRKGGGRILLIVDQFEELFTLCRDSAERRAFVDALLHASTEETGDPTLVVITLRADFYHHCAQFPELRAALERQQLYIGPMATEELRRAITQPAKRERWDFEPGLVDLMLRDVGEEPGALPLLSHALLETWKRRRGRTLALGGYQQAGGVHGAIARSAEAVYQGLDQEEQAITRAIFLRLTELGEGTQDTRRRVALSELVPAIEKRPLLDGVINTLAGARLITTRQETVEVAHEALIREWPTLRNWLEADREGLRIHRHLTDATGEWERLDRDPGELYRGSRLVQALEWAAEHSTALNPQEHAFLEASEESARQAEAEREAQQQRELMAAKELAAERARAAARLRRRALYLAGALMVVVLLTIAAAVLGLQANRNAELAVTRQAKAEAEADLRATAEAVADERREAAEHLARLATSRELAAATVSNLNVDPERSILLAIRAVMETYAVDQTVLPEAEVALHEAVQASRVLLTLPQEHGTALSVDGSQIVTADADGVFHFWDADTGDERLALPTGIPDMFSIALSPDGNRLVATATDGTASVWEIPSGQRTLTLSGHTASLVSPAWSPDGSLIATTSFDGTARVWDAISGKELHTLPHNGLTAGPDFSPDGTLLAVADDTVAEARVWDVATGEEVLTLSGHIDGLSEVRFSPDGTRLATAGSDATARVWDAKSGEELLILEGHSGWIFAIEYSPGGDLIVTGSQDGTAKVWDAVTGRELRTLVGHAAGVGNVYFSPDGGRVLTRADDGTAKLWDITLEGSRDWLTLAAHPTVIIRVAYSPDCNEPSESPARDCRTRLATASFDGTAKVLDAETGEELLALAGHSDSLYDVAFSPDGTRLATASYDGTAKVWDAETGDELLSLEGHKGPDGELLPVLSVSFGPGGTRLATGGGDAVARIWDARTGDELLLLEGHTGWVFGTAFSPDGRLLATVAWGADEGEVRVWDTETGEELLTLEGHAQWVNRVAFSPEGTRLATASHDSTAKVWDVASGRELFTLAGHTGVVWDVAYSPDGERLATCSFDNTTKLWDAATGRELLSLTGHQIAPSSVAFSPDGNHLAASGGDGTVRIYVLPIEELIALAQDRVTRSLTDEECFQYLHVDTCPPD
jgi:WD40 repeat protein/DNA-binding SARP family transcriptional activator